jgi:hypothetical protein
MWYLKAEAQVHESLYGQQHIIDNIGEGYAFNPYVGAVFDQLLGNFHQAYCILLLDIFSQISTIDVAARCCW